MKYKKGRVLRSGLVVALLLTILLPQALPVKAAEGYLHLSSWLKSPVTPVLDVGPTNAWDDTGVGAASVITDNVGAPYKMWYTGYNGTGLLQIGYATSANGTGWIKYGTPVLTPAGGGSWDDDGVGSPRVIKVGTGDYRMWYTGYKMVGSESIPQIGYATSDDGITWTKQTGPVLTIGGEGAWDKKGAHSPWVITDNVGAPYKMWYTGRSGAPILGNSAIGYATWDGISANWTKYNNGVAPVVSPTATTWDQRGVATASVIKDGGKYYMWYTGYAGFAGSVAVSIGAAQSDNATTWNKNANRVLTAEATGWNSAGVGAPSVLPESFPPRITMWYSGLDGNLAPSIGRASIATTTVNVTIGLQGDDRTENQLRVPFIVKLFDTSLSLTWQNIVTKMYGESSDNFTTSDWGATGAGGANITSANATTKWVTLQIPGVIPGTYQLALTSPHNLINLRSNVVVTTSGASVNMSQLQEGNGDDSWKIDMTDFGLLAVAFLSSSGGARWNARADYDNNLQINIADFTILAMNFNENSPVAVTD